MPGSVTDITEQLNMPRSRPEDIPLKKSEKWRGERTQQFFHTESNNRNSHPMQYHSFLRWKG